MLGTRRMKKPKLRKPRAKPSIRHKSKKDYNRTENTIFKVRIDGKIEQVPYSEFQERQKK